MMGHPVSQRPQNKPMYLPNNSGPWEFQAYNYEEDVLTHYARRRERVSLDETRTHLMSRQSDFRLERFMKVEETTIRKQKQQSPSSSGRFVSLLNTFFSQLSSSASSIKKRATSSSRKDGEEGDSRPGNKNNGTRKRRNSMSQFLSSRVADSRSLFQDHKQVLTLSRDRDGYGKSVVSREDRNFEDDDNAEFEFPKQRLRNPDSGEDRRRTWQDKEKVNKEADERYDSDSSSDLFELKNF